jgi:hypothetical protein
MDMCAIPQQIFFFLQALKLVENPTTSIDQGENPSLLDIINKLIVNAFSEDNKGKPFVPPFLLTFEVFNKNLCNYLVDSGESSNVMPLSI